MSHHRTNDDLPTKKLLFGESTLMTAKLRLKKMSTSNIVTHFCPDGKILSTKERKSRCVEESDKPSYYKKSDKQSDYKKSDKQSEYKKSDKQSDNKKSDQPSDYKKSDDDKKTDKDDMVSAADIFCWLLIAFIIVGALAYRFAL